MHKPFDTIICSERMYILPYVLEKQKASQSEFCIQTLWLFLAKKGKVLWETDEKTNVTEDFVQKEYLEPNGFFGTMKHFTNTICLFEVDPTKTNIKEFYMWCDKDVKEEDTVWRPFFKITGHESYAWEEQEMKHSFGSFGTCKDIWDLVLRQATRIH